MAVSESWLIESIPYSFVTIEGYSVVRGDFHGSIRKHGTCLYVRDNLRFEEVETKCPNIATVCFRGYDLWIMSVYRPLSYTVEENLLLIGVISNFCEAREVIVFGDFNLPLLLWSAGVEMSCASQNNQLFLDCFTAAGLSQWVEEVTFSHQETFLACVSHLRRIVLVKF